MAHKPIEVQFLTSHVLCALHLVISGVTSSAGISSRKVQRLDCFATACGSMPTVAPDRCGGVIGAYPGVAHLAHLAIGALGYG